MRFAPSPVQRELLAEVDELLDGPQSDRDKFAALGQCSLLAVHWPVEYGGRGLSLADHAVVAERIGMWGLPDEVHLVSIQGVGCTILVAGTDRQRAARLPRLADGTQFASLLLSEKGAGTDLAGLATTASPSGSGFRLSGEKAWTLCTDWSDFCLCSARTRAGRNPADGLSLFLVDLELPGVTVSASERSAGGSFFDVRFEDVEVGEEALLGQLHKGWGLILRAIGFERIGIDYVVRAQRWLRPVRRVAAAVEEDLGAELLRHERAVATARMLAYRTAAGAVGLDPDEVDCALSKAAAAESAQALALWAATELLPRAVDPDPDDVAAIGQALMEAPELGISGGATEIQLDLIGLSR